MRNFFLGICFFLCISGCTKKSENVIKIALVCPLTGDVAAMGQGMKRGMEIAIEEANSSRKLGGKLIELAIFDDRADPKEAVNAANRIISDKRILGVIGHLNSGCSIPASQIYAKRNLAMITPASTNPKLTLQGLKNVFRLCTTDDVQGTYAAEYVINVLKKDKVAIIHDKTAYGQGISENFKKRFEELHGTIVSFDGIDSGDKDYKALLTTIKTKDPSLVYFGGMYTEGGLLTKQSKELGLMVPHFSGDGIYSPEYIKIGGKATEGDYATMMGVAPENLPKAQTFLEKYKTKYPGVDMQSYDIYTYEAAHLLIESIAKANQNPQKIVENIAAITYDGVLGTTNFDKNGDTLNKAISIYQVADGKFIYLK